MIKVNLLDSVTERAHSAAVVEEKVTNPRARFWLLGAAVFGLLAMGMLFDYVSAAASQMRAKQELEHQQQIAAQMAAVNKEQAELEKKLKDIQTRNDAIKRPRAARPDKNGKETDNVQTRSPARETLVLTCRPVRRRRAPRLRRLLVLRSLRHARRNRLGRGAGRAAQER